MKNKKLIIAALVAVTAVGTCMAKPGRGHHHGHHHRHHHHHHRHHCSGWGRGGRHFWPGFLGGVAAGIVVDSVVNRPTTVVAPATTVVTPAPVVVTPPVTTVVAPAPVVVTPAPVYQTQNVWVEGRYVDQVQPNGTVVRTWVPGHYEQRTVQVQ